MPDYAVYGKIHIDHIRHVSSERLFLGGGGPQAAFGIRVWSNSVGFLTRSGSDLDAPFVEQLRAMGLDLSGWKQFDDLPTPHVILEYDADEYLITAGIRDRDAWMTMMQTPIPLPESYRAVKAIHLVTEWADTAIVGDALALRAGGALFSLEPIIDHERWANSEAIWKLLSQVDVVTPDWPSASGIAGSDDPRAVLHHWTGCGAACVAIRHGAQGAYLWARDEDRLWHLPPVPIEKVIDPTGAGNAFGGGLCAGWTETRDARTAGSYGAISAYMLLRAPGIPPLDAATQAEARALLEATRAAAREM